MRTTLLSNWYEKGLIDLTYLTKASESRRLNFRMDTGEKKPSLFIPSKNDGTTTRYTASRFKGS